MARRWAPEPYRRFGVCLAVGIRADLDALVTQLGNAGIAHTEPVQGHRGRVADVPDPDGHIARVHTLV